jgi:predicted PurR-regulated permease PerM
MRVSLPKRPPIVRLPPRSNAEIMLSRSSQVGAIVLGLVAVIFALDAGKLVLAPVVAAIVVGLMLGPVASAIERRGIPAGVSALAVVLLFIGVLVGFAVALATPMSAWSTRVPQIWQELQIRLDQLREPIDALRGLRDQLRSAVGDEGLTVSVEESSPVESMAYLAPALIGQALLFFASLYFFVATRLETRNTILRMFTNRRARWRVGHIFRDVEQNVSRYLLSIALINLGLGIAVWLALTAIGLPSAALWGALAGLMNFVVYVGPAVMAAVLFAVGLTEYDTLSGSLIPPLVYLTVNAIEAQFVTPHVIGRTMTLNPFMVILALAFWIWLWGPLGGFIAIPILLIIYAVASNIVPGIDEGPR